MKGWLGAAGDCRILVDNAVSADARQIDALIEFAGEDSYLVVADDGWGMTGAELAAVLRFGTRGTMSASSAASVSGRKLLPYPKGAA